MDQEWINDVQHKSLPEWKKEQLRQEDKPRYPNECKCGKPAHGNRQCASCGKEAQPDDGILTCRVEGCGRKKEKTSKMCPMHRGRWYTTGRFDLVKRARELEDWYEVDEKTGCFEFIGGKDKKGYGRVAISGKMVLAHRALYEKLVGPIPEGMLLCHSCDNPGCMNPDHIFIGTHQDNSEDMITKGRQRHAVGENNARSKLKTKDVLLIREMAKRGKKTNEMIVIFGVTRSTINDAVARNTWKHI